MSALSAAFSSWFDVADDHSLRQVSWKRFGRMDADERWIHEELDARGVVVARYESWSYVDSERKAGWRKFSSEGKLIEEHDSLVE